MIRIFIGADSRQPVSYHVLAHSIMARASVPVSIAPLKLDTLPITRRGLTEFTFSRFLVPWLCDYEGHAIFMDADMLCLGDVAELWEYAESGRIGTVGVRSFDEPLQGQPRKFERASLMVFNNRRCQMLTPEFIEREDTNPLDMLWAGGLMTPLPDNWNRLVGYEDCSDAKLLHYTAGIPAYDEVAHLGRVEDWYAEFQHMTSLAPFKDLMGNSVHNQNLGIAVNG